MTKTLVTETVLKPKRLRARNGEFYHMARAKTKPGTRGNIRRLNYGPQLTGKGSKINILGPKKLAEFGPKRIPGISGPKTCGKTTRQKGV